MPQHVLSVGHFELHFIDCSSFCPTQCQEPRQWDHFTILLMVNINFCVGGGCKSNPGLVYMPGVWIHLSVWQKAHKRLFDFYVHNRATHVTTKAFSDATETAVGSSNSRLALLLSLFFSPNFQVGYKSEQTSHGWVRRSMVNPLSLTMKMQIKIMLQSFLRLNSKRNKKIRVRVKSSG